MKVIGVTCDDYKVPIYRKGLLKDGFTLKYDGKSGIVGVHLFRIEVEEKDYAVTVEKLSKTLTRLELEFRHSN